MSRNRGKPTIRHLSYMVPTQEERTKLLETAIHANPITTAILGAVFVEHELEQIIRNRFPRIDDTTWASLLQENGPVATFNQKIPLGAALRIYDPETRDNLKIISSIRNAFGHSKRLIEFDNELVEKEIRKISIPKFKKRDHHQIKAMGFGAKDGYIILCIIISTYLSGRYAESLKAKTRRLKKKRQSPFYQALIGALGPSAPKSDQQSSQPSQNGGPSLPVHRGLLDGLIP